MVVGWRVPFGVPAAACCCLLVLFFLLSLPPFSLFFWKLELKLLPSVNSVWFGSGRPGGPA